MVTDNQARILMKLINQERTLEAAAAKAGMSGKTARKYRKMGKLPSQCKAIHDWRTRPDPFEEGDWRWVEEVLENNDGIEAKTLFEVLQREYPGKYQDGQLRTFQRRVKQWQALKGPGNEVFFPQVYKPGHWCESDFTRMKALGITINGSPFDHMLYHFVLCFSNWETGTVCFSESYESLSAGLQNALWKLGGVPTYHRTDNLTSAVNPVGNPEVFTDRYMALANHYGFESRRIQPGCPHENGDVEQRHNRLKTAIDQALMLRGSRDFAGREQYERFLEKLFDQLNAGRRERLKEELKVLRRLPIRKCILTICSQNVVWIAFLGVSGLLPRGPRPIASRHCRKEGKKLMSVSRSSDASQQQNENSCPVLPHESNKWSNGASYSPHCWKRLMSRMAPPAERTMSEFQACHPASR